MKNKKSEQVEARLRAEAFKAEQHGNPLDSSEMAIRAEELSNEPTQADFEREMLREQALEMVNLEQLENESH
jgi:hypothetical protein